MITDLPAGAMLLANKGHSANALRAALRRSTFVLLLACARRSAQSFVLDLVSRFAAQLARGQWAGVTNHRTVDSILALAFAA